MDASTAVKKAIASLEARVAKLKALDEVLADEEIAKALQDALGVNGAVTGRVTRKKTGKKARATVYDKIVKYFQDRNNAWATLRQMVADTKISIGSLRNELYKQRREKFERDAQKGGGRETKFRLKNPQASSSEKD